MPAIWIVRTEDGVVDGASVAEWTDPQTLKKWRDEGRKPELIVAETVTLLRPLPAGIDIIQ